MNNPNIYIYRVVFDGGSGGTLFSYPLLIDFSSFGSKRDSGPHRRVIEERFVTDIRGFSGRGDSFPEHKRYVSVVLMIVVKYLAGHYFFQRANLEL